MDKLQLAKSYCCDCACRGCNLRTGCLTIGWFSVVTYALSLMWCTWQLKSVWVNKHIFEEQNMYGTLIGTAWSFEVILLGGVIISSVLLVAVYKQKKTLLLPYMIAVIVLMFAIAVAGTMNYNNIKMQKTAFIPWLCFIRLCLDVYFLFIVYRYRNEVNHPEGYEATTGTTDV